MDTLTITQLDDALFHIYDVMERCVITDWFALDQTAKSIKDNEHIQDVVIGFEERQFNDSNRQTFKQFTNNLVETDKGYSCDYNGVPITVKVFKNRIKYFENADVKMYKFEPMKLPNPFKEYWFRKASLK